VRIDVLRSDSNSGLTLFLAFEVESGQKMVDTIVALVGNQYRIKKPRGAELSML